MLRDKDEKINTSSIPIPMCIVNQDGKIVSANSCINRVFIYSGIEDSDFFALTGIRVSRLLDITAQSPVLERNGHSFRILATREENSSNIVVVFDDVTEYRELKEKYRDEKTCICRINVDNYEELIASVAPEIGMKISTEVDAVIRKWAAEMNSSIEKIKETLYTVYSKTITLPRWKNQSSTFWIR